MAPFGNFPLKFPFSARFPAWFLAAVAALLVSFLIVAPFFRMGVASGHDFEFHATSWLDAAGQFREGIFYPRWTEWANYGFGEPRFIFYPPLSWMLGAALSLLVRWDYVPVLFIILVQTFAGFSAFAFTRRLVSERAAIFASAFYAANPNALLMIYFRSDYAELLASAFYPLVFLGAMQLSGLLQSGEVRRRTRNLAFFAAMFAAVWLSNAPAGVMATYSATLLFLWAAFVAKSFKPILRGAAGLALGFGLAAVYLVPAAYEQRWVNIAQALAPGLLPSENFLYTAGADPEHTFFNYIASTIAVLVIVLTGLTAIAARRQIESPQNLQPAPVWRAFLLLAAVSTTLMLRPSFAVWELLPKLRFVQFPWRWMSIVTIPLTYFLCAAVRRGRLRWVWISLVCAALAGTGIFLVRHTWWDDEEFPTLTAAFSHGEGFEGTDEYDPVNDDHYNLRQKTPPVTILTDTSGPNENASSTASQAEIFFEEWAPERKAFRVSASKPVRLALRLVNYPAWRVEVNGVPLVPESADDTGQMMVELPAGDSRVVVRFTRTRDRTIGGLVSLTSVATLGLLLVAGRKPRALLLS